MNRAVLTAKILDPNLKLRRLSPAAWAAVAVLAIISMAGIFAPLVANHNPLTVSVVVTGPSQSHWLGTDGLGRDIFSRLVYGTRWSLTIGLGSTLFALVAGAVVGSVAASSHHLVDEIIMRSLDVIMALPGIALAAVLVLVLGRAVPVLIAAIGFVYLPSVARLVRANVLSEFSKDYVQSERISGARTAYILIKHVAINCAAPVVVFATILVADAIVFESALSFIGTGIRPPNPSWGSILADGKNMILTGGWWATFFPGLLILLAVLSLNILAENIADVWAAPSARPVPANSPAHEAADTITASLPIEALKQVGARIQMRARNFSQAHVILAVENLRISFANRHRGVDVIDGVSFQVRQSEVLALIGESGCGKSLTSLAVVGLEPTGAQVSGSILFEGEDLLKIGPRRRRAHLGHNIAMVYQDALSSLNPAMTIRAQLKQFTKRGGTRTPTELLEMVNLDPRRTLHAFPFELSGGQCQRVLIAMALSRDPKLIVADEPTTALDVTVQAQVMELLMRLKDELGFALIFVSHDLALVANVSDRVVVMYGGQVAESATTAEIIGSPRHHYTRGLLSAVISLEEAAARPTQIKGVVPSPADFGPGCRFASRCPAAQAICWTEAPVAASDSIDGAHQVACHFPAQAVKLVTTTGGSLW
jgi:peptide/nickel transport system permease protein